MYSLKVENDRGNTLELTNNPNYTVFKIEGLNPPHATINSSVNTTTDGSSINSVRLENRNIVIYVTMEGDVEANRINLYKYFPVKKTVKLYFSNKSRDIYIEGAVELIECDLFSNKQVAQISIICPRPYFKDVENLVTVFSDVSAMFEFPFSISKAGVEMSTIGTNQRRSIVNTGDIETGVIIKLFATGTVVNPVIYDVLKRTNLKLNFTMLASDTIVINTNVGEKSIELIRDGVTYNAMGYMAQDSTWFILEAGDNVFTYDADSGNSNLQLTFTTAILYSGV
jgi:predicted phage tail component-like protein